MNNKEQDFITELGGIIRWLDGTLDDLKYLSEVWGNALKLCKSDNPLAIEAGEYAKRELMLLDLDGLEVFKVDKIETDMNVMYQEEV